jgi:hypothetical protein
MEAAFTASTSDYLKIGAVTMSGTSAGSAMPTDDFAIGNAAGNVPSYIDIGELWILRAVPTAIQLEQLDDYARAKYGDAVVL